VLRSLPVTSTCDPLGPGGWCTPGARRRHSLGTRPAPSLFLTLLPNVACYREKVNPAPFDGITRRERLRPGDRVRLVSPASAPSLAEVQYATKVLHDMGLQVECGRHALDAVGYMAGTDKDRLQDLNDGLRDPGVAAVVATRGGKGAYRIADGLDLVAARANRSLMIGFSDITVLHLALWRGCRLPGIHGAPWGADEFGPEMAASFRRAVMASERIDVHSVAAEPTAELTTTGRASGILLGGNQDMVATSAGWNLPSLDGAILLLEAFGMRLGHIDRQLTMLTNAGFLRHVVGVAVGQYTDCGADATTQGDWTAIDVLRDRLHRLGVPVLGGLPIGHGRPATAVPVGTMSTLDADAGTLTVAAAVR
jgi:muramoyltetrapeptide carboxypeptidase